MVSAGTVAKTLEVTPQAAQRIVWNWVEKMTGRGRARVVI
nr:helix-turn-helix domain-containing protein [Rhizobium cellulosilyticum]